MKGGSVGDERQIVIKHESSGCVTCLIIVLILFIGLPVLAVVLKIAFLVAIFEAIKKAFGL